jgi:hypothetical protein
MTELPPVDLTDREDVENELEQAIDDSIDMDWTARDGARAIQRWLDDHGFVIVPVAPIRETAELLRSYERHHRDEAAKEEARAEHSLQAEQRLTKAQHNAEAAAKLEALLGGDLAQTVTVRGVERDVREFDPPQDNSRG